MWSSVVLVDEDCLVSRRPLFIAMTDCTFAIVIEYSPARGVGDMDDYCTQIRWTPLVQMPKCDA